MSCGCKNQESEWQMQVCEVCKRLDQDTTEKNCKFCSFCQAWICESDETNWYRRAKAALKSP